MLIEPFWAGLGEYACMIGPFETLRECDTPSSKSLTLDYDGMPPYLQLLPAIKINNPVLGILVLAILLPNILGWVVLADD